MRSVDDNSGKHAGFTNVLLLVSKQEVQWYNFFTWSMSVAVLVPQQGVDAKSGTRKKACPANSNFLFLSICYVRVTDVTG